MFHLGHGELGCRDAQIMAHTRYLYIESLPKGVGSSKISYMTLALDQSLLDYIGPKPRSDKWQSPLYFTYSLEFSFQLPSAFPEHLLVKGTSLLAPEHISGVF